MEISFLFSSFFFFLVFVYSLFKLFSKPPTKSSFILSESPEKNIQREEEKGQTQPIDIINSSSQVIISTSLPQDLVIYEILPKLPAKSLVRFKSVSKPWKALITDQKFISSHLNCTKMCLKAKFLVVKHRYRYPPINFISVISGETNSLVKTVLIPLEADFKSLKIVGSVHGLLCIADHECGTNPGLPVVLWNLSIEKFKVIPRSIFSQNRSGETVSRVIHGFGYCQSADDYKVVRILHVFDKRNVLCFRAEIYSMRSDSWHEVDQGRGVMGHKIYEASCVALNDALHWIAFGIGRHHDYEFVLSFDLGLEKFWRLELPEIDFSRSGLCTKLAEFGGKLGLITYTHQGWNKWFQVWTFDEDVFAWENKLNVGPFIGIYRPLGFGWNEEIYMEDKIGRLALYESETDWVRKIEPICAEMHSFDVHLYVESLVWKD